MQGHHLVGTDVVRGEGERDEDAKHASHHLVKNSPFEHSLGYFLVLASNMFARESVGEVASESDSGVEVSA